MVQTSLMRKKIEAARTESIKQIKLIVGETKFNQLLEAQGKYYDTYFKFDEKKEENTEVESSDKKIIKRGYYGTFRSFKYQFITFLGCRCH